MNLKAIRNLATFAPSELGDTILATPLYRALRGTFPSVRFTALSQIPKHPVLEGLTVFDEVVDYNLTTDLTRFDLVVLPVLCGDADVRRHFDSHSNIISADRLHAARRSSLANKWNGKYSHLLFYQHQVEMNMELAHQAGYEGQTIPPYCPQGDASRFVQHTGRVGLFINTPMNEFQAMTNRQWPMDHWKALIDALGAAHIVLIGGPSDRPNMERLASEMKVSSVVTDSLADFTAVCRTLKVLVTTDGGAMHAAATSGVPIISLHGTSSPILLHPWIYPAGKCIAVLSANTCSPCQRSFRLQVCESGLTKMDCMQNLRPEVVESALDEIETLAPGTCLIMKGSRLLTKQDYLQSWRRSVEFMLNYNASRLALKVNFGRSRALPTWNTVEHSNTVS